MIARIAVATELVLLHMSAMKGESSPGRGGELT